MKTIVKKNFANWLTILRIILIIPLIIFLIISYSYTAYTSYSNSRISFFLLAFFIFLLASLTDFWDGWFARKYNTVSNFGKIFDPIADKILVTSVLISFIAMNIVPWYLVVIFFLRDISVDGLRIFAASKNIVVAASFWGKLKTVLQVIAISVCFIFAPFIVKSSLNYWLINLPLILASLVSLLSGIIYIKQILSKIF